MGSQPEAIGTGHRPYGRTHLPLRSIGSDKLSPPFTACTCLRIHRRTGVRAPKAVAGQGGLPATSAKDKSWSAMSGGPGEPSRASPGDPGGAPYGRRTVPTVRGCVRAPSRGSERVKVCSDSRKH